LEGLAGGSAKKATEGGYLHADPLRHLGLGNITAKVVLQIAKRKFPLVAPASAREATRKIAADGVPERPRRGEKEIQKPSKRLAEREFQNGLQLVFQAAGFSPATPDLLPRFE